MTEEKKEYNFKQAEEKIRRFWDKEKVYRFDSKSKKEIYAIDTPPPTVSGKMHIGHAFQYSQMDFMARFMRMSGKEVFYPFGTDDNGLPTERLIEKLNNVKSKNMDRVKFIELCLKTLKEITPGFIQDWKNLAISCDYDILYSTIDKNSQKLSQKSFIELFKQGRVYKKDFPSLWCPECQTSIAQAELEDKELASQISTIKFSVDGKELGIATTRPELLGACVAVFVNPKDKRYKNIIGKKAKVPLFDFSVSVIADESADMEKGTGAMMICSYGDKYDAEAVNRCKLIPRIILNKDGTINYGDYKGIKIKDARKKILADLESKGLIVEKKQVSHAVNVHDKCGTEIEILPTEQWFIKILDIKKRLLEQGKKVTWRPEFMLKRYENWVNGLQWDWNISRDRHFGIPIPAWQCPSCGKILLADEKELPIDPVKIKRKCSCGQLGEPELKVFDTWQTSSLTPEIASSLINGKIKQPYSVRCNAHDIIRTWDFYTITKSYMHKNTIPWENMMISGFVTLEGEKMSKSKGNVISPQEITEKYGADALRYWASSSKLGEDTDFQEKEVITGKKFVTKILNATRFVFINLKNYKPKKCKLKETDRLFLSKLNKTIERATESFENYEHARAKQEVMNFFWHIFCDNYLELVKGRIYNGNKEEKESAGFTLYSSLLAILKMMAPITPYITEELYQEFFKNNEKIKSIHLVLWPEKIDIKENKTDNEVLDSLLEIISDVRMKKSKAQKSMKSSVVLTLEKDKQDKLKSYLEDLQIVLNAKIKEGKFDVEFI